MKELKLLAGERHALEIDLKGQLSDTGTFELSIAAAETDDSDTRVSETVSFDAVFDPEEVSPVQARRCDYNTLSQRVDNHVEVLYALDGYFCFDLKQGDTSVKNISVSLSTKSKNIEGLDEINESLNDLSFENLKEHRIKIPFSFFVDTSADDELLMSVEVREGEIQTYTIRPQVVVNSLWLAFAELQSVPELKNIQTTLFELPNSSIKKYAQAVVNLFLYRRERTDEANDEQKARVETAQTLLAEIKDDDQSVISPDVFLIMQGLADSYSASIKKADGGGAFIESSVKNFTDTVETTPNDWVLRFFRGIILVDMGRGIKDDFLGNLVYGDDAVDWIKAGEADLELVITAHEFAALKDLDWSIYNPIQQAVPDEISDEAVRVLDK